MAYSFLDVIIKGKWFTLFLNITWCGMNYKFYLHAKFEELCLFDWITVDRVRLERQN